MCFFSAAEFAAAYADLNELDHRPLAHAVADGRVTAVENVLARRFDVLDARCVPELPRPGIKGVRLEIHHVWKDEVAVFLFDRNQQAVMRPADDSRFAGVMLVAVSPVQFSHLGHRHSIGARHAKAQV